MGRRCIRVRGFGQLREVDEPSRTAPKFSPPLPEENKIYPGFMDGGQILGPSWGI